MRLAMGLGALLTAAAVAGCGHGSGGGGASPSPSLDAYQQAVKFSQCMRAHGVPVPDPQSVNGGAGVVVRVTPGADDAKLNPDSQQFKDAQNACKQYMPNGGYLTPEQQAEAQQNALKFAQCMRAHGVDIPDPQPGSGGVMIQRSGTANGNANGPRINPDDPKFQAAQKACQSLLGDAGGPGLQINNNGG